MNCLSHMLNNAARQNRFRYHTNCSPPKLTHLSFADDLLIFIDGSINSVQQVLQVLKEFEMRYGLAVSMQKTCFYASGMTGVETDLIQASTGMSLGSLPFRYLGVPLNSNKLSLVNCEPLIHQIKTRFSCWSVKSLSFSWRLLFIKTVIAGITTFWCSAFVLPKACINRINSLCSIFLWKGAIEGHNSARVSWETVVLTKRQGGLGVKDLLTWNRACTLRLLWLLFFRPESVWVQWFKEVILKGSVHNYWSISPKQSYSWLVNKLLKLKTVVYPLIKLRLENGETARFWTDNWTPFGDLHTFLSGYNSRLGIHQQATVSSLYSNGSWQIPPARSEAQLQLYAYLTTLQLTENQDYYEWEVNAQVLRSFKTGVLYDYLTEPKPDVVWHKVIWISRPIPRHSFHALLVIQNRLPTRDRLISWGLQTVDRCLLCNSNPESRDHLFLSCNYSTDLWNIIARRLHIRSITTWQDTLDQMLSLPPPVHQRNLTLQAWQSTLYWLWTERNARLHSNTFRSVDQLFKLIDRQLRNKLQSFREENPARSSLMMQSWLRFS
ncbi:PREDICTED: uncharacterized protein LOC106336482 [Brassica oleracea var. oleracea]|uniref:uncharacterized protein LOC106336482 n=1 Tax=Brassica oleracea var. oleracea TaxID=109376 RepID=UPI0006A6B2BF|nr:PREDICTED: uncharacterized protein LOC106336482 [Brassica oleracea var. oleracea]